MKTLGVGLLKSHFSQVLEDIRKGKEIAIAFGKKMEKVAVIIPFSQYKKGKRKLGLLEGKAKYKIKDDFKMTDKEFLTA